MLPTSLSFVDIETTGANPLNGRIIEIGILRVENNQIVDTLQTLINPQMYLDPFIENLTGIKGSDLENAPVFFDVKEKILGMLKDAIFVAHNVRFDYGFLRNEFKRNESNFSSKHFCTVKLSKLLYPRFKRHNLDTLIERFEIDCKNRHRAFDDAHAIWQFYQKAEQDKGEEVFEKAVMLALKRPSIPLAITQEILETIPETAGVYTFYGENGMPLYIGKSINIKERVLSHFSSDHLSSTDSKIAQQIQSLECIETAGELSALFLESELVKKNQPLFNKKLRYARKLLALKKKENLDGYASVEIVDPNDVSLSELDQLLGVYTSQRSLKDFLYMLCKTYTLCPKIMQLEKTKKECFAYHLDQCSGACVGKIEKMKYNLRFDEAFFKYRIKPWPFAGPIVIKEKSGKEEHFIVDKWCLLGNLKSEADSLEDLTRSYVFDYDTYKILRRFLKSAKPHMISPLSPTFLTA